jgi:hypothetical protein
MPQEMGRSPKKERCYLSGPRFAYDVEAYDCEAAAAK